MQEWEVWFAKFPYEEDASTEKSRPVIILSVEPLKVLSVKVTSHSQREYDEYDVPIEKWKETGFDRPSIARISKTIYLTSNKFDWMLGKLLPEDIGAITNAYMKFIEENT